jgi:hypothetical protein
LHESQLKNINVVKKTVIISLDLHFYFEGWKDGSEELAAISLPPALNLWTHVKQLSNLPLVKPIPRLVLD